MDSLYEDYRLSGTAERGNSDNLDNVLHSSSAYTCLHCGNLPVQQLALTCIFGSATNCQWSFIVGLMDLHIKIQIVSSTIQI